MKKMKLLKYLITMMLVLLCTVIMHPVKTQAAVSFEQLPVTVVDDMTNFDQVVKLSWNLDWNLSKETGVTEQCRYAMFSLASDSFVRIKMSTVNESAFAADDYFRLYANETMAVPLTDNDIGHACSGDDYFFLKAGTYYIQCGSKLYYSGSSNHSTRIMIGAVPESKGVQIEQVVSEDHKSVTVSVTQRFAEQLGEAKWKEGRVTSVVYNSTDIDASNSFKLYKNGWYTVALKSESSVPFNKDVQYFAYINVTGIDDGTSVNPPAADTGAKKGVTYAVNNLKYKLVKEGMDGTGTVMVTGIVKAKKSVSIPAAVAIRGQSYKVVKIGSKAFYKKSKIKNITIKSKNITSFGKNAFKGINKKAVFKVPKSKYKNYKKLLNSKSGFAKKTMKIKK